ncbi:hypothetical protein ABZ726_38490, partial [Streptomyces hundungensis]
MARGLRQPGEGAVVGRTGTRRPRHGSAPAAAARFPPQPPTVKNPLWTNTAKAYDFVGFDPRGVGHST